MGAETGLILAGKDGKEIKALLYVKIDIDLNGTRDFEVSVHRDAWTDEYEYGGFIFKPGTEIGGRIGRIYTDTALSVIKVCGLTWRGMMNGKVIEPPAGQDYKTVSGELNSVLKGLIEPEFDGLFVVSSESTGVTVSNYQFERYTDLLSGITKMLQSVGYRIQLTYIEVSRESGYVLVEAVPIVDYSSEIELSQDSGLDFQLNDIRNGYNHMIVAGKGELSDRNVFHLYAWPDGSIRKEQYYTGIDERTYVYENTSTETAEVETKAREEFAEIMNRQEFSMNTEALQMDVSIGDIIGGRDYLTGTYMAKPVTNIIYTTDDMGNVGVEYQVEGED